MIESRGPEDSMTQRLCDPGVTHRDPTLPSSQIPEPALIVERWKEKSTAW